jgi:hypothetical protein
MPRSRDFRLLLAIALLAMAASTRSARADLVTTLDVSPMSMPGGLTEYDYKLSDLSTSSITASSFFVAVDATANLTRLSAPVGWDISYDPGDLAVAFTSPDPSFDVMIGSSGLFSFDSLLGPVLAPYEIAGIDSNYNYLTNDGTIYSASVPEPASAALLAVGVLGMMGVHHRYKKGRPAPASR